MILKNNLRKRKFTNNGGITLIALVITIIVLLILAGVSISMLSGDNSILNKAGQARDLTGEKSIAERVQLAYLAALAEGKGDARDYLDTELEKEFGNGNYRLSSDKSKVEIDGKEYKFDGTTTPGGGGGEKIDIATLKSTLENSNQDNVQINQNGEISDIVWHWEPLNNDECEICGYWDEDDCERRGYYGNIKNGELKDGFPIFIKSNNKVLRVTKMGKFALMNVDNIEKIEIPEGITLLGDRAFMSCHSLKSVSLPSSLTYIGERAFIFCSDLQNINIPEGITHCGAASFRESGWLDSQPDGPIYIGKVFYDYKGTIPSNTNLTINDGTVRFADSDFYHIFDSQNEDYSGLKSIILPTSFMDLRETCFAKCIGLTSITINKSKDSISGAPWGAPNMTANDVTWN